MATAKSEVIKNGDSIIINFIGQLDEDVTLPTISMSGVKSITFDFKKLTLINSCGIRDWIAWLNEIPDTIHLVYVSCPVILIDQINMVEGLIKDGSKISSFYIPYYCEVCDVISNVEVTEESSWKEFKPEEYLPCNKCKEKVEIDVIESKYFKFLKRF